MSIAEKLEELLDHEKDTLLKGDLDKLEKLAEVKELLSSELGMGNHLFSREEVANIAKKSARNKDLLFAAQRGIQSAINQLREATEGSFQSYSREGVRAPITRMKSVGKRI